MPTEESTIAAREAKLAGRGRVIAGRITSHLVAGLAGVGIALATNLMWESYGSPDVSVQSAVGMLQVDQRYAGGNTVFTTSLRDLRSYAVLLTSRGTEPGEPVVRAANQALILKLVVQNQGRKAASNIRIPIYVSTVARPSITATPNVRVSLDSAGNRSDHRNDVVVIEVLQPRTSAVVTYQVDMDSLVGADLWRRNRFEVRVPSAVSDETGPIEVPRKLVPLGLAMDFEGHLSRSGTVLVVDAWRKSPSPWRTAEPVITVNDPWLRNSDSMAASHRLRSAEDYARYIRDSFRR